MPTHSQTIDPRTLQVSKPQPLADLAAAVLIGFGLAAALVLGWSA